jgi:hypothetical protein
MAAHSILRTANRWLWRALLLLSLTSCGGVDSGGTGSSVAYGPVNGLGSIIVDGVRFDERTASITDEDGRPVARDRLQLGVMTTVEGSATVSTATERLATAYRVRISSELVGPVDSINLSAQTIEVLRQTVRITPATVFEDGLQAGLADLQTGVVVEVFARLDSATGTYAATRIELRPGVPTYVLRGKVDRVDATALTFRVGQIEIDFSSVPTADAASVVAGSTVRVRLETTPSGGTWHATSVSTGQRSIADGDEASVEGRISAYESPRRFSLDGVRVDATAAAFPDGELAIVLGARVSVEGSTRQGVLSASVVRFEGDEDASNSQFEVHGTIDALDTVRRVLIVHAVAVDYSGNVEFVGGTISDMILGRSIEVKGGLQPDGVGLVAQRIEFKSN